MLFLSVCLNRPLDFASVKYFTGIYLIQSCLNVMTFLCIWEWDCSMLGVQSYITLVLVLVESCCCLWYCGESNWSCWPEKLLGRLPVWIVGRFSDPNLCTWTAGLPLNIASHWFMFLLVQWSNLNIHLPSFDFFTHRNRMSGIALSLSVYRAFIKSRIPWPCTIWY